MPHIKSQALDNIWPWRQSWSCDKEYFNNIYSGKDVFKCCLTADGSGLTQLNNVFLLICLIPCLQIHLVDFSHGTCFKTINSNVKVSILSFMQLLEHLVIIRAVRYDSKVMTRIFPTMLHISGRKLYSEI